MKQLPILCIILLCACSKTKDLSEKPRSNSKVILRNLDGNWFSIQKKNQNTECFYGINDPSTITLKTLNELFTFHTEDQEIDEVGMNGRNVTQRNINRILSSLNKSTSQKGKLVFKQCIGDNGDVIISQLTETEVTEKLTSKQKKDLVKAASGYKYEKNDENTCIQCGQLTVVLQN